MTRFTQSVRLGIQEQKLIADEMASANITFSEALRRLVHRGAEKAEPVYLVSQVSCKAELEKYSDAVARWRYEWGSIDSLMRAKLPPDADAATVTLVSNARTKATKHLEESLVLGSFAVALAKKMMGIGPEELAELRHCKRYFIQILASQQKLIAAGQSPSMQPEILRAIERVVAVLKGLGI
jgi:hypothetical protein